MTDTNEKRIHQGRNVKRFREMMGWKQEGLASALGEDWTQKRVSLLEAREEIDPALLEQVARALKVPSEAIRSFDEELAVNIISNTFNDNSLSHGAVNYNNHNCNFNPLDKYVEQVEENKRLFEALLKSEREKIALFERMLEAKD